MKEIINYKLGWWKANSNNGIATNDSIPNVFLVC